MKSNAEEVKWAIETARLLGREVMTPAEYREYIGVEPRTGNDPVRLRGDSGLVLGGRPSSLPAELAAM